LSNCALGFGFLQAVPMDNVIALEPFNQVSEAAAFTTLLIELSVLGCIMLPDRLFICAWSWLPFWSCPLYNKGDDRGEGCCDNLARILHCVYLYDLLGNMFFLLERYLPLIIEQPWFVEGVEARLQMVINYQKVGQIILSS